MYFIWSLFLDYSRKVFTGSGIETHFTNFSHLYRFILAKLADQFFLRRCSPSKGNLSWTVVGGQLNFLYSMVSSKFLWIFRFFNCWKILVGARAREHTSSNAGHAYSHLFSVLHNITSSNNNYSWQKYKSTEKQTIFFRFVTINRENWRFLNSSHKWEICIIPRKKLKL